MCMLSRKYGQQAVYPLCGCNCDCCGWFAPQVYESQLEEKQKAYVSELFPKYKKYEHKLKLQEARVIDGTLSTIEGFVPRDNMLRFEIDHGVFFGMKDFLEEDSCYVGKRQGEDGHILVIGGPGTCKTTGIAMPTLGTWGGRIIAFDIKGNGGDLEGPWRKLNGSRGKKLLVFNPMKEDSAHYDPYSLLRFDGEKYLVKNAHDMAQSILPIPCTVTENRVWIKMAQNLLTGAILYCFDQKYTFVETMIKVHKTPVPELVEEIMGSDDGNAKGALTQGLLPSTTAAMFVSKLEDLKPEILAGVGMDFGEFVVLAVDPWVRSAFTDDGNHDLIDLRDFLSDENPYDMAIQLLEDSLDYAQSVSTLMMNQITKMLERRADYHSEAGKALLPVLVMLDEFPRLGTSHAVKNGLATLRSRGVTFVLFIQNLAQLDERYGTDGRRTIVSNCDYKVLLGVSEPDEQEYFSRLIGNVNVPKLNRELNIYTIRKEEEEEEET